MHLRGSAPHAIFRLTAGAVAFALVLGPMTRPADAAPAASPAGPRATSSPPGVHRAGPPLRGSTERRTTGALVVTFEDGTSEAAKRDVLADAGARRAGSITDLESQIATSPDRAQTVAQLRSDPRVRSVTSETVRHATDTPNDVLLPYQLSTFAVRLPAAWDITHGSSTVDIAVLDTGVDLDHPDLAGRILPGYDFVNGDANASDDNGHGTMVAGVAAANTNNAKGVAGAAWTARIMPVKVLDADGSGADGDIANGIVWAVDHGAEIINLSLGGAGSSSLLGSAVMYAKSHGRVVVAAAGNEGSNVPTYPAAIPDVVAVGATDDLGEAVAFTNRGPWIDLVAPGWDVISTTSAPGPNPAYSVASGTSFSAPLVAGIAALVRAKNPTMSAAQVAARLTSTAADRGIDGFDDVNGFGLVDAYAALGGRTAASPTLAPADGDGTPLHANGTFGDAEIAAPGDVDWYYTDQPSLGRFGVSAAAVSPSFAGEPQAFEPDVTVFDPDFNEIATVDTGSAYDASVLVPVTKPGRYTIRVRNAYSSRGATRWNEYPEYTIGIRSAWEPLDRVAPITRYGPPTSPIAAVTGDFTGDGQEDLIVSSRYGAGPIGVEYPTNAPLLLYPHTDANALPEPIEIATDINVGGADLTSGDVDGDGDIDVVLAGYDGIDIFPMTPAGLGAPIKIDSSTIRSIRVADMDDDDDADLVYTTWADVRMRLQDGGVWGDPVVIDAAPLYTMEAGDVTGDGRTDVVGGTDVSYGVPGLRVIASNGDSSFHREDRPRTYLSSISDVEVADVNHDGRADVLAAISSVVSNEPKGVELYAQEADGGLATPERFDAFSTTSAIAFADATGDGRPDIVALHPVPTYAIQAGVGVFAGRADGGYDDELVYFAPASDDVLPDHVYVSRVAGDHPDLFIPGAFYSAELWQVGDLDVPLLDGRLWVSGVAPSDMDQGVDPLVHPEVTFARAMDASTITSDRVRFVDAISGTVVPSALTYDAGTRTATIVPAAPLTAGRPYRVTVTGVKDADGATMDEHVPTNFTVAAPAPARDLRSDIDRDGFEDIVTGTPGEDLGSAVDAGAVTVLYGSASGPVGAPAQQVTLQTPGVPGASRSGDRFGAAVAVGDVNADGFNDVAVGAPGRDVNDKSDAGEVYVLLGSPRGLIAPGTSWTQDSDGVPGGAEPGDRFGGALAVGRFDAVPGADVAIGVPGEGVGSASGAGAVYVLRGASMGVTSSGATVWTQDSRGIGTKSQTGDGFGQVLAAGDSDGDSNDELAVGMPLEDVSGKKDSGAVVLFRGSINGLRPSFTLADVPALIEPGDRFGAALTFGEFGGTEVEDAYRDLAIAHPGENGSGAVSAWYSDQGGVGLFSSYIAAPDPQVGSGFGASLAAGRTTRPVLAVGMPGYDYQGIKDVGKVWLNFGAHRLDETGYYVLQQGSGGMQQGIDIPGATETGDRFGAAVAILDVDGDEHVDWIVGVPNESTTSAPSSGEIDVMRWATSLSSDAVTQDSPGVPDASEASDGFGGVFAR